MQFRFLMLSLIFILAAPSWAAPPAVLDGSTVGASATAYSTGLTISSLTVPSGTNQAAVVCLSLYSNGGTTQGLTVTRDGQNFTRVTRSTFNLHDFNAVEAWVLNTPNVGTAPVVITTDSTRSLAAAAMVVSGQASQSRVVELPQPSNYDYNTSLSLTDSPADALLTDCVTYGFTATLSTVATGQTLAPGSRVSSVNQELGASSRVGPGALSWHASDYGRRVQVLLEWLPPTSGGGGGGGGTGQCDCTSDAFSPSDSMSMVTDAPYSAVCDGTSDDLGAFTSLIRRHGTDTLRRNSIKIPNRTCKVTNTVQFRRSLTDCPAANVNCWIANSGLFGSGSLSEIKLENNIAPCISEPKPVVYTASIVESSDPSKRRVDGSGAKAFNNSISDLIISSGLGNIGGIGIDWINSNFGTIRRTDIHSEDNKGVAGILAARYGQGPGLWDHLTISGYDRCIDLGVFDYGMTASSIACNYNVEGIRVTSNAFTIRNLTSNGPSPAIDNVNSNGVVILLDSTLTCTKNCTGPAIVNAGRLFARNITCVGFAGGCLSVADGGHITEYTSDGPFSAFTPDAHASLNLPIEDPPRAFNPANHALRANCTIFGANPTDVDDDSVGIAAALSAHRPVVYCPAPLTTGGHGYKIGTPLSVPADVQVIDFLGSSLGPFSGSSPSTIFYVGENSPNPLVIRRVWSSGFSDTSTFVYRPPGVTRTVVIEDTAGKMYRFDGPGKVFLSNTAGRVEAHGGASVWARQLDTEESATFIVNDASKVWVQGWKTERGQPGTLTTNGGCTEILGGLVFPQETPSAPLHTVVDSSFFAIHAETAYVNTNVYPVIVRETRAGVTQDLPASTMPKRGLAVSIFASAHTGGCNLP